MSRTILHLDLDAFFCAVEEQFDPSLSGRAFAVGARPDQRGVVSTCSYAARRFGVKSAMPMGIALRLCPHLIVVPARHGVYSAASRQVMARLHALTPLVEQLSIDEAFMDVTDLVADTSSMVNAETLARQLQSQIWEELNLPASLGVAANKLVAKIANNIGKSSRRAESVLDMPPRALTIVPPGEEAAFLAPLAVEQLWGVGPHTATRLKGMNLHTIGDVAATSETEMIRRFGRMGYDLVRRARGLDERPVVTVRRAKSMSRETTFARDIRNREVLAKTLLELSESVSERLQSKGRRGSVVKIKVRWHDFTSVSRQETLREPTDSLETIHAAAQHLFDELWAEDRPVRLLGVGVGALESEIPFGAGGQLSLFEEQ